MRVFQDSTSRSQPQSTAPSSLIAQSAPQIQTPTGSIPSTSHMQQLQQPQAQQLHVAQPSPLPQQVQFVQQGNNASQQPTLDSNTTSTRSSPLPPQLPHHLQYPPGVGPPPQQHTSRDAALQQQQQQQVQQQQIQPPVQQRPSGLPSSLADLVASFEGAKQKGSWAQGTRWAYIFTLLLQHRHVWPT